MQYTDTHCHLDSVLEKLNLDNVKKLKLLFPPEFKQCITISCDPKSIAITQTIMEKNSWVYGAFGIHPHESKYYNSTIEKQLIQLMTHKKTVAWGEIGLDYFYEHSDKNTQKKVFILQIKKALEAQKPLIIHTRNAEEDTFQIMVKYIPKNWKIHVHCFTSSMTMSKKLLKNFSNLYLGFTGIITFKNAFDLIEIVKQTSIDKILLETDSPYLAPIPHRGKTCHSGYIPLIANKISSIKNILLKDIYLQTQKNTKKIYNI